LLKAPHASNKAELAENSLLCKECLSEEINEFCFAIELYFVEELFDDFFDAAAKGAMVDVVLCLLYLDDFVEEDRVMCFVKCWIGFNLIIGDLCVPFVLFVLCVVPCVSFSILGADCGRTNAIAGLNIVGVLAKVFLLDNALRGRLFRERLLEARTKIGSDVGE
jgi:ABC-type methionine transport system permease subunit